jgi:hypothetical protein
MRKPSGFVAAEHDDDARPIDRRWSVFAASHRTGRAQASTTFKQLPAFCRVAATLTPSTDSDIRIEVWMPVMSCCRIDDERRPSV